jgi:hypothetical protein
VEIRGLTFVEKRDFYFVQNCKFAQTHFSPDGRHLCLPMHCQMEVKNSMIKSHGRGLPNGTDSSTCRRCDAKIRCPEDGVLSRLFCFFQNFLTTRLAVRARRACFLLRAGTFHSCQQVVSSKSLVLLILCYIFPLLFLTGYGPFLPIISPAPTPMPPAPRPHISTRPQMLPTPHRALRSLLSSFDHLPPIFH